MAFPIIPRVRSGATGYPNSLFVGELAVNTFDGSLYLGCDSGVAKINSVGIAGSTITEWTATEGQTVFVGINGYVDAADGSYLVSVGGVDQPGSAYAIASANSGTLTLASGAPAGVIVAVRAFVGGTGGGGGSTNATQLQGRAVSSATPNDGDALVWSSDPDQAWVPAAVKGISEWNSSKTYQPGDVVYNFYNTNNGLYFIFIAVATNTNVDPYSDAITYSQNWKVFNAQAFSLGRQSNNFPATIDLGGYVSDGNFLRWNESRQIWEYASLPFEITLYSSAPLNDGGLGAAGITPASWINIRIAGADFKVPAFQ